ncbi:ArgS-related anticodon-binding protein NrtL [Streptomyces tirandamycinicus]|uniref:ArgS-related anticodon-binding protein NrtL n=1 Tax=Streptomyces tirandamycinicus TaxID=2174846 RepID=UPI00226FF959|nr:DALR anticodon-binding domain-containing protein [Streptomyces tirandamycinicus]MCY0980423.1 DALR anticodon-binding domain-containing protein [Streptomyces tirandamycinicus]
MTPADLSRTVLGAVRRAVEEGALHAPVPERIRVERPRPGGRGDYATNVALRLAGPAGRQAREVAEAIRSRIAGSPGIAHVEITGPGFLNFTLGADPAAGLVRTIGERGLGYGHGTALSGVRVGFAPVRELRARVITDTVVRLLGAQGAAAAVEPDGRERISVLPARDDALFERAGRDAALWALLRPAAHDQPLPAAALLVQKESNALFRVRYAYSRSRALVRAADRLGIPVSYEPDVSAPGDADQAAVVSAAGGAGSSALLAALGDHPAVLESAARLRAPDRLARHLEATADALLGLQHTVLPVGDEKPSAAHRSRLALAEAAGTVLAGGLALLGISAPEHL